MKIHCPLQEMAAKMFGYFFLDMGIISSAVGETDSGIVLRSKSVKYN